MRWFLRLVVSLLPIALALAFIYDVGGVRTAFGNEAADRLTKALVPSSTPTPDDNSSGNGFRYAGRFYWVSGQEVRPGSVGRLVDRRAHYQDGTVTIRKIVGVKSSRALAARISGTWTLVASDMDEGADPASIPRLRTVLGN